MCINDPIRCEVCGYSQHHPFVLGFMHDVCIGCITPRKRYYRLGQAANDSDDISKI